MILSLFSDFLSEPLKQLFFKGENSSCLTPIFTTRKITTFFQYDKFLASFFSKK